MKVAIAVLAMVSSAIAGNLLLKSAAVATHSSSFLGQISDPRTLFGLMLFGASAFGYLALLKLVPLNIAQSFMALQFVGVILGSYLVLNEPLPTLRLVGVALIAVGIVVVGFSQSSG